MELDLEENLESLVKSVYWKNLFQKKTGGFFFQPGKSRFFSLGRYALLEGLKLLGLQKGDGVLIPALVCRDLLAPLNILELKIHFYDVDENLELTGNLLPNCKAIIAINYFGFPQNLVPFRDYCRKNNSFLIEDNAHGFLSADPEGVFLGSRGDLGIFSLRKSLPLYNGGALQLNNPSLKFSSIEKNNCIKAPLFSTRNIKNELSFLSLGISGKQIQKITLFFQKLKKWKTHKSVAKYDDPTEFEIPGRPEPIDIGEVLLSLDQKKERVWRRKLYDAIHSLLLSFPIIPIFNKIEESVVPYSYPFYCDDKLFEKIESYLRNLGLEAFTWPALPQEIQSRGHPFYGKIRLIRFLW